MTASIISLQMILLAQLCISPITIDDKPQLHKISRYTSYLLPTAISVASENSVSTLNTPSDSIYLLPSDNPNTLHGMKKCLTFKGRVNIGCCCRKLGQIICYKNTRFY